MDLHPTCSWNLWNKCFSIFHPVWFLHIFSICSLFFFSSMQSNIMLQLSPSLDNPSKNPSPCFIFYLTSSTSSNQMDHNFIFYQNVITKQDRHALSCPIIGYNQGWILHCTIVEGKKETIGDELERVQWKDPWDMTLVKRVYSIFHCKRHHTVLVCICTMT